MKSAGKARNNGLYRHIRTSKEIIRNLLNDLEKILIARRARSSYETCFVISFLINHKTGSAVRRCLPD